MVEQAVASDGHYILHSVSEALEWETGVARSIDHMFQLVVLEVCDHAEYYQDFHLTTRMLWMRSSNGQWIGSMIGTLLTWS